MALSTDTPYIHDVFTIKQYNENIAKITYLQSVRESGWEDDKKYSKKCTVNNSKLNNNLSRAKSTVKELVLCNEWHYWCTFTISPDKYDRKDLKSYIKDFTEFLHNYNKRCIIDDKVKYILVPEQHSDGAWHMHGFIKGIRKKDLYINCYGYLTWKQYEEKFGFISMDYIKDIERASSYILKYMTKDNDKNVTELNSHIFYASKGLNRAVEIYKSNKASFIGKWDWEHPDGYCKIKNIDLRKESITNYLELKDNDSK